MTFPFLPKFAFFGLNFYLAFYVCLFLYVYITNSRPSSSCCLSIFLVYSDILGLLSIRLLDKNLSWSPLTLSDLDQLLLSTWEPLSFRHLYPHSEHSHTFSPLLYPPLPIFHVFLFLFHPVSWYCRFLSFLAVLMFRLNNVFAVSTAAF